MPGECRREDACVMSLAITEAAGQEMQSTLLNVSAVSRYVKFVDLTIIGREGKFLR